MSNIYRSKHLFKAEQVAPDGDLIAEKDREEHNRRVARWILEEGGDVEAFTRDSIVITTEAGEVIIGPGDWIVKDPLDNNFYHVTDDVFHDILEPEPLEPQQE